jgi:SAM-dependent methyltransferase
MSRNSIDYLRYAWQMVNGSRARSERELAKKRQRDISPYLDTVSSLHVLDLANGRLRPQYTLLKAAGHLVFGIDLANRRQLNRIDLAYSLARRLYIWKLGLSPRSVVNQTLVCGDVGVLPFPDSSFDLVSSVAAFEHFSDVPKVVDELTRVIRPAGLAWVGIHLFTSLSGGHNISLAQVPLRKIPAGVDPWDHLRQRRLPFHVPLNEWRLDQYLETFSNHFEILKHYCAMREGEELLTPAIEDELSAYSRDELTCGAYVILARKPSQQAIASMQG